MKTVRLDTELYRDVKEFALLNNIAMEYESATTVVKKTLMFLLYGVKSKGELEHARNTLVGRNVLVKGQVAQWAATVDWSSPSKPKPKLPDHILAALVKTAEEVENEISTHQPNIVEHRELEKPKLRCKQPWKDMERVTIEQLKAAYPNHTALKWPAGDTLKERALECAFAAVPRSLHRSTKIMDMAMRLYSRFRIAQQVPEQAREEVIINNT